jgi:hypothetical protein
MVLPNMSAAHILPTCQLCLQEPLAPVQPCLVVALYCWPAGSSHNSGAAHSRAEQQGRTFVGIGITGTAINKQGRAVLQPWNQLMMYLCWSAKQSSCCC